MVLNRLPRCPFPSFTLFRFHKLFLSISTETWLPLLDTRRVGHTLGCWSSTRPPITITTKCLPSCTSMSSMAVRKRTSRITRPVSSWTSRAAQISKVSPGSRCPPGKASVPVSRIRIAARSAVSARGSGKKEGFPYLHHGCLFVRPRQNVPES